MKYLVVVLNVLSILFFLALLIANHTNFESWKTWAAFMMLVVTPMMSLGYAFRAPSGGDLMSLYFQRKAAEQRAAIRKLEAE